MDALILSAAERVEHVARICGVDVGAPAADVLGWAYRACDLIGDLYTAALRERDDSAAARLEPANRIAAGFRETLQNYGTAARPQNPYYLEDRTACLRNLLSEAADLIEQKEV